MLNGSSEWSPLRAARTVSDGNLASDENHEDEVSTLATTKARQIKREIIRRNVDEEENAQAGIRSIYKFGKTLGKGSFAIVKEAEHKETGALVAVKIIDKVDEDKFEEREVITPVSFSLFRKCFFDQNTLSCFKLHSSILICVERVVRSVLWGKSTIPIV